MIAYVCDECGKVIPKNAGRYLLKSIKASNQYVDPVVICLCESCKDKWAEKVPELFRFNEAVAIKDVLERRS